MQTNVQKETLTRLKTYAKNKSEYASKTATRFLLQFMNYDEIYSLNQHIQNCELTLALRVDMAISADSRHVHLIDSLRVSDEVLNYWQTGTTGGADVRATRDAVERQLFGYPRFKADLQPTSTEQADRPRFAALNLFNVTTGSRLDYDESYGPVALVLHPLLNDVATFVRGDSNQLKGDATVAVGAFDHFQHVLVDAQNYYRSTSQLLFRQILRSARGKKTSGALIYWEAQVHAKINFKKDVQFLRVSYKRLFGTAIGSKVRDWARANGWPLVWGHKHNVIVDPAVHPPRVGKRRKALAIDVFERQWDGADAFRSELAAAKRPEYEIRARVGKYLASRWYPELWHAMPERFRVEPGREGAGEPVQHTLRHLRLRRTDRRTDE